MKQLFILLFASLIVFACDTKKTSIAGRVINQTTGEGVNNVLVSYVQCKEDGDNCTEVIIGQMYTLSDGSFKIDQKTASKSKRKWITVYNGNKKLATKENIGLTDTNIIIEVTP